MRLALNHIQRQVALAFVIPSGTSQSFSKMGTACTNFAMKTIVQLPFVSPVKVSHTGIEVWRANVKSAVHEYPTGTM
jgi:hypothetical protein